MATHIEDLSWEEQQCRVDALPVAAVLAGVYGRVGESTRRLTADATVLFEPGERIDYTYLMPDGNEFLSTMERVEGNLWLIE